MIAIPAIFQRKKTSLLLPILFLPTLLALLLPLGGCQALGYYGQAISGHLKLTRSSQSIDQLLDSNGSSKRAPLDLNTRAKLGLIKDIRAFAQQQIQLPVGNAYTRYVDLQRDYVVWNVFAAPELSLDPLQWCFPVAGCVSYRGYFARDSAVAYADGLAKKNYDTHIGGASAYSTLGWFSDPVLNNFLKLPDIELAALLFHELSHRKIYIKGDTDFNESFATAMADFSVQHWAQRYGDAAREKLQDYHRRKRLKQQFIALVGDARARLQAVYSSTAEPATKRRQKAASFAGLRQNIMAFANSDPYAAGYARWAENLNNAKLIPVVAYSRWVVEIRAVLDTEMRRSGCDLSSMPLSEIACQRGLAAFYHRIDALQALLPADRVARLESWSGSALLLNVSVPFSEDRAFPSITDQY